MKKRNGENGQKTAESQAVKEEKETVPSPNNSGSLSTEETQANTVEKESQKPPRVKVSRQLELFPEESENRYILNPGKGTPSSFSDPVVMLRFGTAGYAKGVTKFEACGLLQVRERDFKKNNKPEFVSVARPHRRKPYSIETLSPNGQIDSPLVIVGRNIQDGDAQEWIELYGEHWNIKGVTQGLLIGEVNEEHHFYRSGYHTPILILAPSSTFIDKHEVDFHDEVPYNEDYLSNKVILRHFCQKRNKRFQKVFGIVPGHSRLEMASLTYHQLLRATSHYEDSDD